jgi:beta-glucosidase/6-phospho-beta-glucosidase/beta-galactosidase
MTTVLLSRIIVVKGLVSGFGLASCRVQPIFYCGGVVFRQGKMAIAVVALGLALVGCMPKNHTKVSEAGGSGGTLAQFPRQEGSNSFFFGLATAPAHVEEGLEDGWIDFARKGKIAAFGNQAVPEARLNFWTNYQREVDLAAGSGAKVFRMGVDWGRLVPTRPDYATCETSGGIQNREALAHYQQIVDYVRSKGMKVMMTLFHHSPPKWFIETGGWPQAAGSKCFQKFGKDVVDAFGSKVDYWVTFNEPAVYNMFVYVAGIWPPGMAMPNPLDMLSVPGTWKGAFIAANENMVAAHEVLYNYIHKVRNLSTPVGIAHNVGWHKANTAVDSGGVLFSSILLNYLFMDMVAPNMDYIGLNYYGAEYVAGSGLAMRSDKEYSDSGRAVDPYGLYALLKAFHERYNVAFVNRTNHDVLPIIVTENGVSERTDFLRPAYMVEHLLAVNQAMREGVKVSGYVYWTISDNWEWADGYCPKFGLYSVDRANGLNRSPREFSLAQFKEIVKTGQITSGMRKAAWDRMVAAQNGEMRDTCRASDGKGSLDDPKQIPFARVDWRFDPKKPSNRFEALDVLDLRSKSDAVTKTVDQSVPFWLRDDTERRKVIGSMLSLFDGFRDARFTVALGRDGRFKLAINNGHPDKRTVCAISGAAAPVDFVFDNTFYLTLPSSLNPNEIEIGVEGVRMFMGPRFSSNFNLRARIEKVKVVNGILTFDSPDMPLIRTAKTDLLAPGTPPQAKCERVPLTKFGNGFAR